MGRGNNLNNPLGTGLGTGGATGALLLTPDELVTPGTTRDVQSLLRVLNRDGMAEEVFYSYPQTLSDANPVPFKLQLCPSLT